MKISDSGDSIQNTGKRANGRGHNTSIDVAKLAGVSQATVSRAFNPASKMNPSTRQRVLDAASALKYAPDAIAGVLYPTALILWQSSCRTPPIRSTQRS